MSAVSNSILKLLSDLSIASDKIIEENQPKKLCPPILEWASFVRQKASNIVESENGSDSTEIPTLKSFLSGTSRQRVPRVSTVFGEVQKSHLYKASLKSRKSQRPSMKIPSNVTMPPIITISSSSNEESESSTPIKRSSKRKSSLELLKIVKKANLRGEADELSNARERDKSVQVINESAKLTKTKNSSLLPNYANIKSSYGADLILKENRNLRYKFDAKQEKAVENRKNILAIRQLKLEENKRTRGEEKLQKTLHQRLMFEKEKLSTLKSVDREKTIKEATAKTMQNKINTEKESPGGETSHSLKNKKEKEITTKKLKGNLMKPGLPSTLRNNEKTPVKKNTKKTETEKVMNTTYVAQANEESTSKKVKGKTLHEEYNSGNTKDASSDKRALAFTKQFEKKKTTESYEMTPTRSSIQSYDISEIRSDSDDEDPNEENTKRIPSWATGVRLRNTLLQQHHHPIDSDELFGNFFETVDLAAMMGVKKKKYAKRTSSAVWNSSMLR